MPARSDGLPDRERHLPCSRSTSAMVAGCTVFLAPVVLTACQPEVLASSQAAACLRVQMLEFEWHPDQHLERLAVAAAPISVSTNLSAQFDGDIGRTHDWALSAARVGSLWPRHFSSTAA